MLKLFLEQEKIEIFIVLGFLTILVLSAIIIYFKTRD
jgi:hypothetical protein